MVLIDLVLKDWSVDFIFFFIEFAIGLRVKEFLFRLEGIAVSIVIASPLFVFWDLFALFLWKPKSGEVRSSRWVRLPLLSLPKSSVILVYFEMLPNCASLSSMELTIALILFLSFLF